MKRLILLTLAMSLGSSYLSAETKDSSLKLLYFTASWCGPCQLMKQETWPNALVQKELGNFDFQTIDVDARKTVAQKWSVRSMPTYLIVDPSGEIELARMSGFMDGYRMSSWLKDINSAARKTLDDILEARKVAEQNWAKLTALTKPKATDEELNSAQQALFTLLQHRGDLPDSTTKNLDTRLNEIAKYSPHHIAKGILHEDLQVRAYITRSLASQDITFDPWASVEARTSAYFKFKEVNANE